MNRMFKRIIVLSIVAGLLVLSGCEMLNAKIAAIKGTLIGNSYNVGFYNNTGENILNMHGDNIGINGNIVEEGSVSDDGTYTTSYELSSVITITIDGKNVEQTGNSVIFASKSLRKLTDFDISKDITTSGGTINILDETINDYKNYFGTPKVVIICSQLGVPICAYGGSSVYWEIPSDLPKMTYLSIDGQPLYLHRVNYIILDTELIV